MSVLIATLDALSNGAGLLVLAVTIRFAVALTADHIATIRHTLPRSPK